MKKINLILSLLLVLFLLVFNDLKADPDMPWNFCFTPKPKSLAGECNGPDEVFCCIDPGNGTLYAKPFKH